MTNFFRAIKACMLLLASGLLLQGCLKDTCTRTYTMYTPVYQTVAEVRANIKNSPAQSIQKAGKMFVSGSYVFLNEVNKGVHVIDNSDPSKPVNKYFINIPGNIDLAVKGNTLYADLYSDMVTLDITDPAAVVVKKITDHVFPFRRYQNGFVADTNKVIVDWIAKDTTIDCEATFLRPGVVFNDMLASYSSAAANPTVGVGGSMARFALVNDYLYTVTDAQINVFNISQPQQPVLSGKVNAGWNIETVYPFKNNLFIGSNTGMYIFSIANPAQPQPVSLFGHVRVCDPVIADEKFAYVTLRSGTQCQGFTNQLDVLNVTDLYHPSLVKSYQLTNPHGLSKSGDLLFICDGAQGLKVFDAANANDIKPVKTFGGLESFDVITYNNIAIVSASDGLYQFDFQNRNNIRQISKLNIIKN